MKKKWPILLSIPVLLMTILILGISGKSPSIHVIGEMPNKDIEEITALLKHELRKEILPNLSWNSLKQSPKRLNAYNGIKLISFIAVTNDEVALFVWSNSNDVPRLSAVSNYVSDKDELTPTGIVFFSLALTNARPFKAERLTSNWSVQAIGRFPW